jgi:AcrR family transcriptional regulator
MSQPSLYHYFPSKDALIREIVEYCAQQMVSAGMAVTPPKCVEELPRFVKDAVVNLYAGETHPRFVRFLFVVAIETKQNRALVEKVFSERFGESFAQVAGWFAQSPEERDHLEKLLRTVVWAIGFALLEERVLFGKRKISEKTALYADWVAEAAERLIASWSARPA